MVGYRGLLAGVAIALAVSNPMTTRAGTFNVSPTLEVSSLALKPVYRRADGVFGADNRTRLKWGKVERVPIGGWRLGSIGERLTDMSTKKIVRILAKHSRFVCSGAVVAPTIVLTAAHCLKWNGKYLKDPEKPVYIEAWNGQKFKVVSSSVLKRYQGTQKHYSLRTTTADQWSLDVGLIYLRKEIAFVTDGFLKISKNIDDSRIQWFSLVGFHDDVERVISKQLVTESCSGAIKPIVERGRGGRKKGSWLHGYGTVIIHKCDNSPGSSGASLIVFGDTIVGVHVASAHRKYALAVNLAERRGPFEWIRRRLAKNREKYGWREYDNGDWQGPHEAPWRVQ